MTPDAPAPDTHAARLLRRLDDLAAFLSGRGDVLALVALGSVGRDFERLDDHSDLDFFVIVEDDAKPRYLADVDWLEAVAPVVFSFENTVDGRKALFADGVFAEYAVFTLDELRRASYPAARVVWRRSDAPDDLAAGRLPEPSSHDQPGFHVNEALTNLYVGLQREARGELLAANRLIQVHAIDRILEFLDLSGVASRARQDPFAVERGAEARIPVAVLPLAELVPGYARNREAALAILEWLEANADVSRVLAAAIREAAAAV